MKLEPSSTIVRSKQIIQTTLGDEVLALDSERGRYFGAEDVGADIFKMIESPISISEICNQLMDSYDITRDKCESDVMTFLNKLHEEGIIEAKSGHPSR